MDLIFPLENSANQQNKAAEIILTLILTHLREAPKFFYGVDIAVLFSF